MRVNNSVLAGSLDGMAAIGLAAYLAAVVYQGNVSKLGAQIVEDAPGFLEFVIALYLITLLVNVRGPIGDIFAALVALAIVVLIIRVMQGSGVDAFKSYGAGRLSLFGLVQKLATGS